MKSNILFTIFTLVYPIQRMLLTQPEAKVDNGVMWAKLYLILGSKILDLVF